MEVSLIITEASAPCQSDVHGMKLEYYMNRSIISSSWAGSHVDHLLNGVIILNDMSSTDLICPEAWNDKVSVGNMILFVSIVTEFL